MTTHPARPEDRYGDFAGFVAAHRSVCATYPTEGDSVSERRAAAAAYAYQALENLRGACEPVLDHDKLSETLGPALIAGHRLIDSSVHISVDATFYAANHGVLTDSDPKIADHTPEDLVSLASMAVDDWVRSGGDDDRAGSVALYFVAVYFVARHAGLTVLAVVPLTANERARLQSRWN